MSMNKSSIAAIALAMLMMALAAFPAKAQTSQGAQPSHCPSYADVVAWFVSEWAKMNLSCTSISSVACWGSGLVNGEPQTINCTIVYYDGTKEDNVTIGPYTSPAGCVYQTITLEGEDEVSISGQLETALINGNCLRAPAQ
jgi:hypothetical protein